MIGSLRERQLRRVISACLLTVFCLAGPLQARNLDSLVAHSLEFSEGQLARTVTLINDTTRYPYRTRNDTLWIANRPGSWVSGWFPGCLWQMYDHTLDDTWRRRAESWTAGLEDSKDNTNTHDVGFIIFCSFGNGYRLTGREEYREVIIQAANSLATRYHPRVGCMRSWNKHLFPVIIDNMMNLEILFWAARNGGDSDLYDMALSHALRTSRDHIREDGGTYQIVDYDTTTGEYISRFTKQGSDAESTWARGQAWGLYGFTMAYRETGDSRLLEAAMRLADYFIDHLPGDCVPYWDFQAPDIPDEEKDVSASAIAASGLLELCTLVPAAVTAEKYRSAACSILASLCSPAYLAEGTNSIGILLHGIQNHNEDKGIDVSLIYADYYFIEALLRYRDMIMSTNAFGDPPYLFPASIRLFQNYPNPFNPETNIWYWLSDAVVVNLSLYDITGRWIQPLEEGYRDPGHHLFRFDSGRLAAGVYVVVLEANDTRRARRITLVR
ncbi:MAG: glycoside hydrolase family 88 protein [Fidelibacterota bacterium]|nr:MAG: glycoside hydrolase family 88 protein [Candidatus Neomarinimicrobiota bacterium]